MRDLEMEREHKQKEHKPTKYTNIALLIVPF